ncbi:hypothetical protein AaE_001335, partial [Aphanomyces astaci]
MDLFTADDAAARGRFSLRDRESLHGHTRATHYPRVHFMMCLCGAVMILYMCWRVLRVISKPFDSEVKAIVAAGGYHNEEEQSWSC